MSHSFVDNLRITEVFYSIQGESSTVGWPTVFVRLTGCPLRCQYCDTAYAFNGGKILSIDNIINQIYKLFSIDKSQNLANKYITISGGEPLAQKACGNLVKKLCDLQANVSIETSGAFTIENIDQRAMIVMDLKTPGSKESSKNLWSNLKFLKSSDQIKFVICNTEDYLWSKEQVLSKKLYNICNILFSPSYNQISLQYLAENILADKLPVRLQTQLHKQIWGEVVGK